MYGTQNKRSNFYKLQSKAKKNWLIRYYWEEFSKIDSMSTADILEGYHDIFASTIAGDWVTNGMLPQHFDHNSDVDGSLKLLSPITQALSII